MTSPRVSVVLATFNGERFVAAQLQSILAQSVLPDELVISDGGSTDATLEIVRSVTANAPAGLRVRVVADGTRRQVSENFENAIRASAGELVMLSDQDDVWHVDRVARALAAFEDPSLLLLHGNARLTDDRGEPLGVDLFTALRIGPHEVAAIAGDDAFGLLIRRNLVTGATTTFRRELTAHALPIPSTWVHDEWLAAIAAAEGRLFADDRPLIDYRQHGANAIGVTALTRRQRLARIRQPRGARLSRLAARADDLVERLQALDAPPRWQELAARKSRFERVRAGYPRARLLRVIPVLRQLRAGSYAELASQGDADAIRDILQPAGRAANTIPGRPSAR